jgi:hypothetical protein
MQEEGWAFFTTSSRWMYLKNEEHPKRKWWRKGKETRTVYTKWEFKILPVSNTFACYGTFFKFKAFNKFQVDFIVKIHMGSLVTQNKPPMLNIIEWLQNSLRRYPIDVDGTFILKQWNFSLNSFFQLCQKWPTVRNVKEQKKQIKKTELEDGHVPKKKLC